MAEGYGNQVGHWRCKVVAEVDSQTDDTAYVHVYNWWQSLGWGFSVSYNSVYAGCDGQSSGQERFAYVQSDTGSYTDRLVYDAVFAVPRSQAARTVTCSASFVMPDYEAGSSYASCELEIEATPAGVPAAPSDVVATRQSDSLFYISWTNNDTAEAYYYSTDVQVREDGGEWGAPTGGTQNLVPAVGSATWAHGSANRRYRFRVRATNPSGYSDWAESADVDTTPAAPTGLSCTFSAGSVLLTWTNAATYADSVEVQSSQDGSSWSAAATLGGSATSWTDASPPSGTAFYRVRTVGSAGLQSAWAASGAVSTYTDSDYPTVTVTGPQSPVRDRPVELAWEVGGPDAVASQTASLIVDGVVVEAAAPSASARSHSFSAAGLPDGGTGTFVVSATDTKGLTTAAVYAVTADYWPPAAPVAEVSYGEGGTASVSVSAGSGDETAATVSFDVVRVAADGAREAVASGVGAGEVADEHPPLNVEYSYEVTAYSDAGKTATASVGALVESACGYVDFADGSHFAVAYNLQCDESYERQGTSVDFAGDSPHPAWYASADVAQSVSASFAVARADFEALRGGAAGSDELWLRDGAGRVWHGHPGWTFAPATGGRFVDVSMDLTVTEER